MIQPPGEGSPMPGSQRPSGPRTARMLRASGCMRVMVCARGNDANGKPLASHCGLPVPPGRHHNERVISIVIPIFNEEENLAELIGRTTAALEAAKEPWEIVFVDDGSRDRSCGILREAHAKDARIKLICLSRNFGH